MNVLDPFEVFEVEIWPLPEFQACKKSDLKALQHLNALEATVFSGLLKQSPFGAVLNEKFPASSARVKLPKSHRQRIVSDDVLKIRGHPDIRVARRAATIARLAQVN